MHGTSATRCEVSLEKNIILHFLITAMRFTDLIKDLLLRETQFFYSRLIRDLSIAK